MCPKIGGFEGEAWGDLDEMRHVWRYDKKVKGQEDYSAHKSSIISR